MDIRISKQIFISDYDFARLVMEKGELSGDRGIVTIIQDEGIRAIRPEIDETSIEYLKVDSGDAENRLSSCVGLCSQRNT